MKQTTIRRAPIPYFIVENSGDGGLGQYFIIFRVYKKKS